MKADQTITNADTIKEVFVHNLSRIYYGKKYLAKNLPDIARAASFKALILAIEELNADVKKQTRRLEEIFKIINEKPSEDGCIPVITIFKEALTLTKGQSKLGIINDVDLILYMQLLEHVNITAYRMLKMLAAKMHQSQIEHLLLECYNESKENDQLFVLISKKYLSN